MHGCVCVCMCVCVYVCVCVFMCARLWQNTLFVISGTKLIDYELTLKYIYLYTYAEQMMIYMGILKCLP